MDFEEVKKLMKLIVIAAIIMAVGFGGCQYINEKLHLEDDHWVEEIIEHKIEE